MDLFLHYLQKIPRGAKVSIHIKDRNYPVRGTVIEPGVDHIVIEREESPGWSTCIPAVSMEMITIDNPKPVAL